MVELLQLFLPTRTATPIDVMTNSLGALLGLLIFHSSWLVFRMAIADTALAESQIQAFLKGQQPPEVYDKTFVAAYHFADSGSYRDRMATLPDFVWKTRTASAQTGAAATLAPSRWLETQAQTCCRPL
jgi:hypothetical protein